MSNRKRLRIKGKRNNSLRQKKDPNVLQRGLAKIAGGDLTGNSGLTPDELVTITPDLAPEAMASETDIIKTVPAKHKGVTVGDAYIHEDGQVTIVFSKDAPKWALDEIRNEASAIGYDLQTGGPDGGS